MLYFSVFSLFYENLYEDLYTKIKILRITITLSAKIKRFVSNKPTTAKLILLQTFAYFCFAKVCKNMKICKKKGTNVKVNTFKRLEEKITIKKIKNRNYLCLVL